MPSPAINVAKTDTFEVQRQKINSIGTTLYDFFNGTITVENTLNVKGLIRESTDGGTNYWNVVTQQDIGYNANQIPLNQYLGQLAFLDDYHPSGLRRDSGGVDDLFIDSTGTVVLSGTRTLTSLSNGDITISPNGTGDFVFLGGASQDFIINDGAATPVTKFSVASTTGNTVIEGTLTSKGGTVDVSASATGVSIIDNNASSFVIREATNPYITLNTTNSSESITLHKNTTVNGNLIVDGDITFRAGNGSAGSITLGDSDTDNISFAADINSNILPNTTTLDIGSSSKKWRDLYLSGGAYIGNLTIDVTDNTIASTNTDGNITFDPNGAGDVVITGGLNQDFIINDGAGTPVTKFSVASSTGNTDIKGTLDVAGNVFINSNKFMITASTGNTTIAGTLGVTNNTTLSADLIVNGNTTLGDSAAADTLTVTARVASDFIPSTTGTRDFGTSTLKWRDLYLSGGASIGNLSIDVTDNTIASTNTNGNIILSPNGTGKVTTVNDVDFGTSGDTSTLTVIGQLNADNIRIDGNIISSTDANGNITFDPNGTGDVIITGGTSQDFLINDGAGTPVTKFSVASTTGNTVIEGTLTSKGGTVDVSAAATNVSIIDNNASAFTIKEGANSYITLNTTNSSESITLHKNTTVNGNLTVDGDITFRAGSGSAGSITLGDSNTDNIVFNADINSSIIPNIDATYDLGSASFQWRDVYISRTLNVGSVIDIVPYNSLGTLSFEGSAGQLFSITNNLTSGSIFSVNDVSGIPSIDVDANGNIQLAPFSGRVGIGTTNPSVKLDVFDTNAVIIARNKATTSGSSSVIAGDSDYYSTPSYKGVSIVKNAPTDPGTVFSSIPYADLGSLAFLNTTNALIYTNGGTPLIFGTFSGEAVRITGDSNRNVGIGVTNPSQKLQVNGTVLATALSTGAAGTGINISNSGTITGPATITIDPSTIGDDTGTVEIKGNLTVQGTTTTINSTILSIDDKNIVIADGQSTLTGIDTAGLDFGTTAVKLRYYYNAGTNSGLNIEGTNVGIGTSTVTTKLDVQGNSRIGGAASRSSSGLTVGFTNNTTFSANGDAGDGYRMLSIVNESTTTNAMSVLGFRVNPNGGTANAMLDVKFVQTGATNTSALHYSFNHAGSFADRFTILSSGNVGIGTTNPTARLAVNGSITESTDGTNYWNVVTQQDIGYNANQVPLNQYLGQLAFLDDYHGNGLRRDGGGVDDVFVNSSGNVGVGTTNPTDRLHVFGVATGGTGGIRIDNTAGFLNFWSGVSYYGGLGVSAGMGGTGTDITLRADTSRSLIFQTGGANERVRITSTGFVGIGTTNPQAKLEVNGGSVRFITSGQGDIVLSHSNFVTSIIGATNCQIALGSNNTEVVRINASGNVGIGTTNPGTNKLQVQGDLTVTGNSILVGSDTVATEYFKVQNGSAVDKFVVDSATGNTSISGDLSVVGNLTIGNSGTSQNGFSIPDSIKLTLGTDSDLQIYHDGSNSYINQTSTSTGDLYLIGNGRLVLQTNSTVNSTTENSIVCNEDGSVELYYDGTKTFQTTELGVRIGSQITINAYDTLDGGTLSFDGSSGQLFAISNNLTSGSLFSINDISGLPSFDIDASGTVLIAPYGSEDYVGIGTDTPTTKLDVNGSIKASGVFYATSILVDDVVFSDAYTFTTTATTANQAILSLSSSDYRSVEFFIQVTEGTKYHAEKILAVHNGTTVTETSYGAINTSGSLSTFDLDINSGNIRLLATPASANSTTFKVSVTAIKV